MMKEQTKEIPKENDEGWHKKKTQQYYIFPGTRDSWSSS